MKPRNGESYKRGYSGFSVKKGFTTEAQRGEAATESRIISRKACPEPSRRDAKAAKKEYLSELSVLGACLCVARRQALAGGISGIQEPSTIQFAEAQRYDKHVGFNFLIALRYEGLTFYTFKLRGEYLFRFWLRHSRAAISLENLAGGGLVGRLMKKPRAPKFLPLDGEG